MVGQQTKGNRRTSRGARTRKQTAFYVPPETGQESQAHNTQVSTRRSNPRRVSSSSQTQGIAHEAATTMTDERPPSKATARSTSRKRRKEEDQIDAEKQQDEEQGDENAGYSSGTSHTDEDTRKGQNKEQESASRSHSCQQRQHATLSRKHKHQSKVKKNKQKALEALEQPPKDDLEFIRKLWETPSVAMILQIIRESLKLQKFSMKDLEEALVDIQGSSLMDEIFTKLLLSRSQNRKLLKMGEGFPFKYWSSHLHDEFSDWFERWASLREKISMKEQQELEEEESESIDENSSASGKDRSVTEDINGNVSASESPEEKIVVTDAETEEEYSWRSLLVEFGKSNPLQSKSISECPVELRLIILKTLVEYNVQAGTELGEVLRNADPSILREKRIGHDSKGNDYFVLSSLPDYRVYRQSFTKERYIHGHSVKARRYRLGLSNSHSHTTLQSETPNDHTETENEDEDYSSDSSVDDFATGGVCYGTKNIEPCRFGWEVVAEGPQEVKVFIENIGESVANAPNSMVRLSKAEKKRKSASIDAELKKRLEEHFGDLDEAIQDEERRRKREEKRRQLRTGPRRISNRLASLEAQREEEESRKQEEDEYTMKKRLLELAKKVEGKRVKQRIFNRMTKKERQEFEEQQLQSSRARRIELVKRITECKNVILRSNSKFERSRYFNEIKDTLGSLNENDYRTVTAYCLRGLQLELNARSSLSFRDYSVCLQHFPGCLPPSPTLLSPDAWIEVVKNKIPKPSEWFDEMGRSSRSSSPLFLAVQMARESRISSTASLAAKELLPFHDPILLPIVLAALIAASDVANVYAEHVRRELLAESQRLRSSNFLRLWNWNRLESQWRRVEILQYAAEVYKRKIRHKKKGDDSQLPFHSSSQVQPTVDTSRLVETPRPLLDLWFGLESKYGDVVSDDTLPGSYAANMKAREKYYREESWIEFLEQQDDDGSCDHHISDDEISEQVTEEETERMREMDKEMATLPCRSKMLYASSMGDNFETDVKHLQDMQYASPEEVQTSLARVSENELQFYPSPVRAFVGRAVIPLPSGPAYSASTPDQKQSLSQELSDVNQELEQANLTENATKEIFGIGPYGRSSVTDKVDPYLWNSCPHVASDMYSDYYSDPRSSVYVPRHSSLTRTAPHRAKALGFLSVNVRIKGGVKYGGQRKKEPKKFLPPLTSQAPLPKPRIQHAPPRPSPDGGNVSYASRGVTGNTGVLPSQPLHPQLSMQSSIGSADLTSVQAEGGNSPMYYAFRNDTTPNSGQPPTPASSMPARASLGQPLQTFPVKHMDKSFSMSSIGATDGGSESGSEGAHSRRVPANVHGEMRQDQPVGIDVQLNSAGSAEPFQVRNEGENGRPRKVPRTNMAASASRASDAATDGSEEREREQVNPTNFVYRPGASQNFGIQIPMYASSSNRGSYGDLSGYPRPVGYPESFYVSGKSSVEGLPDSER